MSGAVEYRYTVTRGMAGAGWTIWRWAVCPAGSDVVVVNGASFVSQESAEDAARSAVEALTLKYRRQQPVR
jgi:hypothetical protein